MKKVTEAALTAGLVAALLLTGCGEKRATDTNDNRPDVVQRESRREKMPPKVRRICWMTEPMLPKR